MCERMLGVRESVVVRRSCDGEGGGGGVLLLVCKRCDGEKLRPVLGVKLGGIV